MNDTPILAKSLKLVGAFVGLSSAWLLLASLVLGTLTDRETQVLRLIARGLSNPEIAARLFLSPRTVEWHLGHVFAKLEIHSRGQLMRALSASDTEGLSA